MQGSTVNLNFKFILKLKCFGKKVHPNLLRMMTTFAGLDASAFFEHFSLAAAFHVCTAYVSHFPKPKVEKVSIIHQSFTNGLLIVPFFCLRLLQLGVRKRIEC